MVTNIIILFVYAVFIIAYAYTDYSVHNKSKQGIILMVTVVICDVYLWMIYKSKLVSKPSVLSAFGALTRYLTFLAGK
jgi:hypothetical protein